MTTTTLLYIVIALLALCCVLVFAWILVSRKEAKTIASAPVAHMPPPPALDEPRQVVLEHQIKLMDNDGNVVSPVELVGLLSALAPTVVQAAPAPVVTAPVPVAEPTPVAEEPDADESEEEVSFDAERKSLTLAEKYAELSPAERDLYDAVVAKAAAVDGVKCYKNARYEEYKCGKMRLVRLQIKRGVIVCEFILYNDDFKAYISENKLKIKPAPTIIRVVDNASLQIALDSIDMVVDDVEAEKEYKRQQARERRRAARAGAKDATEE